MLEYGVRQVITNPKVITQSNDIVKIVDNRSHKTRAFVIPAIYESMIEDFVKELEYKKWVAQKKRLLKNQKSENLDDISEIGIDSINEYLK